MWPRRRGEPRRRRGCRRHERDEDVALWQAGIWSLVAFVSHVHGPLNACFTVFSRVETSSSGFSLSYGSPANHELL